MPLTAASTACRAGCAPQAGPRVRSRPQDRYNGSAGARVKLPVALPLRHSARCFWLSPTCQSSSVQCIALGFTLYVSSPYLLQSTPQQRNSVAGSAPSLQRVASTVQAPAVSAVRPQRRLALDVSANTQRSNSVTKKRTSGPPGLPPINDNSGGGGGGGWDGHRLARNLAINAGLFAIYCILDSGGPGNIFGGGGGGGGGELCCSCSSSCNCAGCCLHCLMLQGACYHTIALNCICDLPQHAPDYPDYATFL